jgi:trehalose synthase
VPLAVEVSSLDPDRFRAVLPPERFEQFQREAEEARRLLAGRVIWNLNSTAKGGGVVELLRPLIAYARGAGIDVRWLVIDGTPGFFELTKRIHNRLHGSDGDGGPLDERARRLYEDVLAANVAELVDHVRPGDIVIVHDPQPAGLIPALAATNAAVIWRCHIGVDEPNDLVRAAWDFLRPYVAPAHAYVFHREAFVWDGLDRRKVAIIPPSIDVFTPKNRDIDPATVLATLRVAGVLEDGGVREPVAFERQDGTPGRVERRAHAVEEQPLRPGDPVVLQVSRWDALKDPIGVIRGFARHVPARTGAHLVYAGPDVEAVADDPEGARMLRLTVQERQQLPVDARSRVHLLSLPMEDPDENALIVNALQRHARVITQKSVGEGFGLTVAEAMWKARPVVGSRVGGIQDQIVDGETGVLIDDPRDLAAFGGAITRLLLDPDEAERLGSAARERVLDRFTSVRSLLDYLALIRRVLAAPLQARRAA